MIDPPEWTPLPYAARMLEKLHALYRRLVRPLAVAIGANPRTPKYLPQITKIDKTIQRVSGGRLMLLDLAGLPSLTLTVPGRKSGELRSTPLLTVPHGNEWLIAGSNFGGPKQPVWVLNLVAAGQADVLFARKHYTVDVIEETGAERDRLYDLMTQTWPNYAKYQQRADRTIRVFRLVPR